jgi:hypothetical protein
MMFVISHETYDTTKKSSPKLSQASTTGNIDVIISSVPDFMPQSPFLVLRFRIWRAPGFTKPHAASLQAICAALPRA